MSSPAAVLAFMTARPTCSPASPPSWAPTRPRGCRCRPRPGCRVARDGGGPVRMSSFSGDQIAQVNNPDPFAVPVWRSPVLHTPGWLIAVAQLVRGLWALLRFLARHPVADTVTLGRGAGLAAVRLARPGRPGPGPRRRAGGVAVALARLVHPVGVPARAGPVAALGLLAALGRGDGDLRAGADVPGPPAAASPGPGDLDPLHRPGARPAGVRASARPTIAARADNLAAELRRAPVPHPHRPARLGDPRAGPPRRPRRDHPRPARPCLPICGRCRSAAARTAPPGWSSSRAPTC